MYPQKPARHKSTYPVLIILVQTDYPHFNITWWVYFFYKTITYFTIIVQCANIDMALQLTSFALNPFNPTDLFSSIHHIEWKSPLKLRSAESVNHNNYYCSSFSYNSERLKVHTHTLNQFRISNSTLTMANWKLYHKSVSLSLKCWMVFNTNLLKHKLLNLTYYKLCLVKSTWIKKHILMCYRCKILSQSHFLKVKYKLY